MATDNIIDISRLKALIETKTREEIAAGIGCDTSTVTKHYTESRAVTIEYLKKYAEFFNVSADYLLGLTDAPIAIKSDKDKLIREICDYTGLYEISANNLHALNSLYYNKNSDFRRIYKEEGHEWDEISDFFDEFIFRSIYLRDAVANYCKTAISATNAFLPIYKTALKVFEDFKNNNANINDLEEQEILLSEQVKKINDIKKYNVFCIGEESKDIFKSYLDMKLLKQNESYKKMCDLYDEIFQTVVTCHCNKKDNEQTEV